MQTMQHYHGGSGTQKILLLYRLLPKQQNARLLVRMYIVGIATSNKNATRWSILVTCVVGQVNPVRLFVPCVWQEDSSSLGRRLFVAGHCCGHVWGLQRPQKPIMQTVVFHGPLACFAPSSIMK